jgi:sec-independent protein translocase protein TatA
MPEMMMIFVIILLLFGAKKLPELARSLGKGMGEFKKARDEFEREITHAVHQSESEVRNKDTTPKPTETKEPHTS